MLKRSMTLKVLGAIVVGFHVERGGAVRVVVVVILDNERRSAERVGWGDRSNSSGSGNDDSVYDNVILSWVSLPLPWGPRLPEMGLLGYILQVRQKLFLCFFLYFLLYFPLLFT